MKQIYAFLTFLFAFTASAYAEDTVGSYDIDGHYVASLPWGETFDNYNDNYDGTSVLPNGWLATGDNAFRTAYSADMAARTGTYYMVAPIANAARNDRAYTPFFELVGGTDYTLAFYLWMPGSATNAAATDRLVVTVGAEQDYEFQTDTLTVVEGQSIGEWTLVEAKYTPAEDGLFTFCFQLLTETAYAGYVGIDDVSLLAADMVLPPSADFSIDANYSFITGALLQFPGGANHLVNLASGEVDSYYWEMPGCYPDHSTEANPDVFFPASGDYTITLTVSNRGGSHTAQRVYGVEYAGEDNFMQWMMAFDGATDKVLSRGQVPTFSTDADFDFYTGPNHYYYSFAERFDLPACQEYTLTNLAYGLCNYSLLSTTVSSSWFNQRDVPLSIVVYGVDDEGNLDPEHVFGRLDGTTGSLVGNSGIALYTNKQFNFTTPIKTKGSFYVALEFGDELIIDTPDANLGRSYFAMSPFVHFSGTTSYYVKPKQWPDGTAGDGSWVRADVFEPEMQGYGLAYYVMGSSTFPTDAPDMSTLGVERVNVLRPAGAPVVYDLQGRRVNAPQKGRLYIVDGKKVVM